MTPSERLAEFDSWLIVEIPFPMIYQRFEELIGRPLEEAETADPEALRREIQEGPRGKGQVADRIPPGSNVVEVRFDADGVPYVAFPDTDDVSDDDENS